MFDYKTNIKKSYFLYYRDFKIELREDPSSIFSSDIIIENTNGPVDYDLSRIYTGKLEGKFQFILISQSFLNLTIRSTK